MSMVSPIRKLAVRAVTTGCWITVVWVPGKDSKGLGASSGTGAMLFT